MPDFEAMFSTVREHADYDIRKGFPDFLEKLGVNQADERAVVHAALAFLLENAGVAVKVAEAL